MKLTRKKAIKQFHPFYIFVETQEEADQLIWLVEFMKALPGPCQSSLTRFYKELVEKLEGGTHEKAL